MIQKVCSLSFALLILLACTSRKVAAGKAPLSDLGHIDLVLDSVSWDAMSRDAFFTNEFGVMDSGTTYYGGKPSRDVYILGSLGFLHLSLAKGYWDNQQGSGAVVFQTRQPGQAEGLLNAWKQVYPDSLFIHTYKGGDFTLQEVMVWYAHDSTLPREKRIAAYLTSYSADAYTSWGITDSLIDAGLAMNQFMASWGGEPLDGRLFHSITALRMMVNPRESAEIESALSTVGYARKGDSLVHASNPTMYITVAESNRGPKITEVRFRLNRPVTEREIVFSPTVKLTVRGESGWLVLGD